MRGPAIVINSKPNQRDGLLQKAMCLLLKARLGDAFPDLGRHIPAAAITLRTHTPADHLHQKRVRGQVRLANNLIAAYDDRRFYPRKAVTEVLEVHGRFRARSAPEAAYRSFLVCLRSRARLSRPTAKGAVHRAKVRTASQLPPNHRPADRAHVGTVGAWDPGELSGAGMSACRYSRPWDARAASER